MMHYEEFSAPGSPNPQYITLLQGDITECTSPCIVNAASRRLGSGTGVNESIIAAGGADYTRELKNPKKFPRIYPGLKTGPNVFTRVDDGNAKLMKLPRTGPHGRCGTLRAEYVIQAVPPNYKDINTHTPEGRLTPECIKLD